MAGVTHPRGFRAAGITAGIKASGRPDVALVAADTTCSAAGVFTRSRAAAAPVELCRRHLTATGGRARAVLVTSGNANAATGARGRADADRMAALTAERLGCPVAEVLVCSTGVIGVPLPMERVEVGIGRAAEALADDGGAAAAEAIRTTDVGPKTAEATVAVDGRRLRVGGIAKGAGMIRPDLGTMIAVLTTDLAAPPGALRELLAGAVEPTFNAITVDGCTSTSDSVLLLASGASGVVLDERTRPAVAEALEQVCAELALAIVHDGEGAGRVGRYAVTGARDDEDARRAAFAVAEDQLVRCALHGADPNWGRIYAALGASPVDVDLDRLAIEIGGVPVLRDGAPVPGVERAAAEAIGAPEVPIRIDLGLGSGAATVWGSDLSPAYVRLNSEYTT